VAARVEFDGDGDRRVDLLAQPLREQLSGAVGGGLGSDQLEPLNPLAGWRGVPHSHPCGAEGDGLLLKKQEVALSACAVIKARDSDSGKPGCAAPGGRAGRPGPSRSLLVAAVAQVRLRKPGPRSL